MECNAANCDLCEATGIKCTVLEPDEEERVEPLSDALLDLCFREENLALT